MDGNTTITVGLIFMIIGGVSAIVGVISSRDAKKTSEGREHGIIETKLTSIEDLLKQLIRRIDDAEERIGDLEYEVGRVVERVTAIERNKYKKESVIEG